MTGADHLDLDGDRLAHLGRELRGWGEANRRDLPWRDTRDPWAVLISEVMLQQTQVGRVEPYYHDFLAAYPTPPACADAPVADVIRRWDGLGFNQRAVRLHRTATRITERHGGQVPGSLEALLELPGIGPYTARAVLAFAFERDHGVVDTNAARVLARAAAGRPLDRGEAQRLADRLVPAGGAWAHNQSVLDFAAAVCRSGEPRCSACPVRSACVWAAAGWPAPDPASASAGTSGDQRPFEGSDRQGRGRLVAALREGPVATADLGAAAGWPDQPARAGRIAEALVADGLAQWDGGRLTLPD